MFLFVDFHHSSQCVRTFALLSRSFFLYFFFFSLSLGPLSLRLSLCLTVFLAFFSKSVFLSFRLSIFLFLPFGQRTRQGQCPIDHRGDIESFIKKASFQTEGKMQETMRVILLKTWYIYNNNMVILFIKKRIPILHFSSICGLFNL